MAQLTVVLALHPGSGPDLGWATAAQRRGGSSQLRYLHGLPLGADLPLPCAQHDAAGPLHLQHVHRPAHPLICVSQPTALDLFFEGVGLPPVKTFWFSSNHC